MIYGILHLVRPACSGEKTVHERHRLRSADGTWERLLQQVKAPADAAGEIHWDISVDSTVVRAHQHTACARTEPPPAPASGGRNGRTPGRNTVAEPARPAGGGGAGCEGLGRSRGGLTSKLHTSTDGSKSHASITSNDRTPIP